MSENKKPNGVVAPVTRPAIDPPGRVNDPKRVQHGLGTPPATARRPIDQLRAVLALPADHPEAATILEAVARLTK